MKFERQMAPCALHHLFISKYIKVVLNDGCGALHEQGILLTKVCAVN